MKVKNGYGINIQRYIVIVSPLFLYLEKFTTFEVKDILFFEKKDSSLDSSIPTPVAVHLNSLTELKVSCYIFDRS